MLKPLSEVIEHHLYMAAYNRRMAHSYRRGRIMLSKEPPGQFYWHMREAIRWMQVARHRRDEYYANYGIGSEYDGEAA